MTLQQMIESKGRVFYLVPKYYTYDFLVSYGKYYDFLNGTYISKSQHLEYKYLNDHDIEDLSNLNTDVSQSPDFQKELKQYNYILKIFKKVANGSSKDIVKVLSKIKEYESIQTAFTLLDYFDIYELKGSDPEDTKICVVWDIEFRGIIKHLDFIHHKKEEETNNEERDTEVLSS